MTRVVMHEPAGARELGLPIRIGGTAACDVRVPGAGSAETLCFERFDDALRLRIDGDAAVRLNGVWMAPGAFREPRAGDVLFVGEARVRLVAVGETLELRVDHTASNDTIEPVRAPTNGPRDEEQGDEQIVPAKLVFADEIETDTVGSFARLRILWVSIAAIVLLACAVLLSFKKISVTVEPLDARVRASGLSWHAGDTLFALPGERVITARRAGYVEYRKTVDVRADAPPLDIRMEPLPGKLLIDSRGVAAEVLVDGAPVGRAPGEVEVRAGIRTVTLRAPRYLDATRRIVVKGMGQRESLQLVPQTYWGKLAVSVSDTAPRASLSVDDDAAIALPTTLDLPAGLHRLSIRADGARPWQGTVFVKAGETLSVGPLTPGAPDARIKIDSNPRGADVTIAGAFRGRTPLEISLTAGLPQELVVTRAGYGPVTRRVVPAAGERLALSFDLPVIAVRLALQGKPADAEVSIDGIGRGKAPLALELPAIRHSIEVRAAGYQTFTTEIDLATTATRSVDFELTREGRPAGWKPPAARIETPNGIALRLLPTGAYVLGSERREQGRRANEFSRTVTFERPVYIATREVTNAQFRAFRSTHASGFVDRRSIDLDAMPVTSVTWQDAAQYCNWLSEREGLAPAYEQRDGAWLLRQPVTNGYRLPTESEWELAARYAGPEHKLRRYEWGDALPPPAGDANLAGSEAAGSLPAVLDGWQDEYPSVAPVGKFAANFLGLQDMIGNVSEWVNDAYASFDSPGAVKDYTGPATGGPRHVIKGGSWRTATFADLRAAWREGADAAAQNVGFRVARYAE